jgi:peroxiredoxin
MRVWNLLVLLSVAVGGAFGQTGLYGPVTVHLKAGDVAPDISFARMLSAPGAASWSQANLTGQVTVVVFYPDIPDNPEWVTRWNAVVEKFAGKPVQFVWVTGEEDSKLLPWLNQHPVKGWVFDDPEGKTGKAYGLEEPPEVIVGADRKIVGFSWTMLPMEEQLNAVLEGRVTTTPPTHETIKAFMESRMVLLKAEPPKMPGIEDRTPHFAPSHALHVSISKRESRYCEWRRLHWAARFSAEGCYYLRVWGEFDSGAVAGWAG